jgi:hypothetical protein
MGTSSGSREVKMSPLIAEMGHAEIQLLGKTRAAKREGFSVE